MTHDATTWPHEVHLDHANKCLRASQTAVCSHLRFGDRASFAIAKL